MNKELKPEVVAFINFVKKFVRFIAIVLIVAVVILAGVSQYQIHKDVKAIKLNVDKLVVTPTVTPELTATPSATATPTVPVKKGFFKAPVKTTVAPSIKK